MNRAAALKAAFAAFLALFLAACATGPGAPAKGGAVAVMSDMELRRMLRDGFERFSLQVAAAADRIKAEAGDLALRRQAVYWKTVAIPNYAALISQPNPRLALVDVLTFTTAMRRSFESGQGRTMFGQWQPVALGAARSAEKDAQAVVRSLLSEKDATAVISEVDSWLAAHPAGDSFGAAGQGAPAGQIRPMPEGLVNAPLSTIKKLTSRLDAATEAVQEITRVGDRIAQVAELSPSTGRWSMELLAYDILQTKEFGDTLASIRTLSESTAALSRLGRDLPSQLRLTSEAIFAGMKEREASVLGILAESKDAIAEANRALAAAGMVSEEFTGGVRGLTQASRDWNDTIAAGAALNRDYIEATRAMMVSSVEMRKIVDETRKVVMETRMLMDPAAFRKMSVEAEDLSRRMAGQADELSRKIADRLFWRAVLLIVVFFAALFLYRAAASSFFARKEKSVREDAANDQ